MAERLSASMRERLDALVAVGDDDPHSPLHHIKTGSSNPSVGGMKRLLARLEVIEATGVLEIDVGWVNGNYQRILFHSVRTASADRVREMAAPRRHLALVCFLHPRPYTEINFAAFGMVGMRFCPRIRSLHRQRIYCADPARDHGVLEPVLKRGRRAVNFRLIVEQWDRIGQFYAAFPAGHATASAALQRLNRFQASNRFYAANRELGRALKTEFVLQYMSEPQLRAKVRRGLLKVEQLHALARAVYYGQRGRISAREVYDQVNACSCLTLIPCLHRLLAGPGDLTARCGARLPVRPRPAASHQPDRVEERRPLRRDQDRPRQAQDARPLGCISARIWSVP